MSRFHQRLREDLRDPEFAEAFYDMSVDIALLQVLEQARKALNVSEKELAERMGVQRSTVTRLFKIQREPIGTRWREGSRSQRLLEEVLELTVHHKSSPARYVVPFKRNRVTFFVNHSRNGLICCMENQLVLVKRLW